ncbi:MAG: hypothetical protein V1847_02325 [Candidatus Diapherotrites archaeon]
MNGKTKIFGIGLAFLAFAVLASAASTTYIAEPAYLINLSSTTFLPSTLAPGDEASLAVNVQNKATTISIQDLNASLLLGNQFEGIDLNQFTSLIQYGSTQTLVFKFRVKEDTLPGFYPASINFSYTRDGERVSEQKSVSIPVSGSSKKLDVSVSPAVVNPGNQTELSFAVKNLTGSPVSNVSVSWTEASNLVLPVGTDNVRYISLIEPGETASVSYIVAADPNITTGLYLLDVNVSYSGASGSTSQKSKLGLMVGGATDFEVSAETSSTGTLSLSIANIGSNDADAVVVKIPSQASVSVSGSSTYILGALNKGDYTLASFQIRTTVAAQGAGGVDPLSSAGPFQRTGTTDRNAFDRNAFGGTQKISIEIDYTDTTGIRQKVIKSVDLVSSAASLSSAAAARTRSSDSPYIPYALAILIAGGFAAFNYWKAKKSWKIFGIFAGISVVLFLAVIFLLSSNLWASILVAVASILAMAGLFFPEKLRIVWEKLKKLVQRKKGK